MTFQKKKTKFKYNTILSNIFFGEYKILKSELNSAYNK